jgi:hypothetical protein
MKSIQDHWHEYREKVYPYGMTADQNRQIHQAFVSGAFVAAQEAIFALGQPDDQARIDLSTLYQETYEFCQAIAASGQQGKEA